jgi:multiple sugar transport system substrate-binding protein
MHDIIQYIPKSNFEMNPIDVAELLSSDSHWIYSPLLFGYTNYSREGFRKYLLRYRDIPVGPGGISGSLLGGAGIAVSSKSSSIVQAQEFSLWLASGEIQKTFYFDAGGQPGNSRAWEDPRLNSLTQDFFTGTRKTLEAAYLRPRDKRFISVQDEISINVTKCLTGEINDLLFAESANEICERLMGANHGI